MRKGTAVATTTSIATGAVNHLRLTVSDLERSTEFYSAMLGFQIVAELPTGVILSNGGAMLQIGLAPVAERALSGDRFNENRIGLDHVAFSVAGKEVLDHAVSLLDKRNVPHGEVIDLGPGFGLYELFLRDPDNIQLELIAPYP
jgi:glyoxylase I family protein